VVEDSMTQNKPRNYQDLSVVQNVGIKMCIHCIGQYPSEGALGTVQIKYCYGRENRKQTAYFASMKQISVKEEERDMRNRKTDRHAGLVTSEC